MLKSHALELLGGIKDAADAIGVTPAAIYQWPDELPKRLEDRVVAAIARKRRPKWMRDLEAGPVEPA